MRPFSASGPITSISPKMAGPMVLSVQSASRVKRQQAHLVACIVLKAFPSRSLGFHLLHSPGESLNNNIRHTMTSGLLRALACLPSGLVARFGETLGRLLYSLPSKRKHYLPTNPRLCFPEKTTPKSSDLARHTPPQLIHRKN